MTETRPELAPSLDFVRGLVRRRAAIVLDPTKDYLIQARLEPVARAMGMKTVDHLVAKVRGDERSQLSARVVEALTTNETLFFRDVAPFDVLRTVVFPALRALGRKPRVWSAACSTGQEAYSAAMVAHELSLPVEIIGTDLSRQAVERARSGRYQQLEVNRGLPARYMARHFTRVGTEWQLGPEILRLVCFREANLMDSWPVEPPVDVIFLRNVLVYFDVTTRQHVLARALRLLRPGGYLFTACADDLSSIRAGLDPVEPPRAGCNRKKD